MNNPLKYVLIPALCYVLGCIHFSYLFASIKKKGDIRKSGTGNAGAANALIVLGPVFGVLTALGDGGKGALAVALSCLFFGRTQEVIALAMISVVIGHDFPFYMEFQGGKGLATTIGSQFSVNLGLFAGVLLSAIACAVALNLLVLGAMCGFIFGAVYSYVLYGAGPIFLAQIGLLILFLWRNLWNIKKIRAGEEKPLIGTIFSKSQN